MAAVAERLGARPAAHWEALFANTDCCVSVVRTLEEAVRDLHFRARRVFDRNVANPGSRAARASPSPRRIAAAQRPDVPAPDLRDAVTPSLRDAP